MDPVRLGLSIRALRRRRGWTLQHLADEAEVSRSALQRIERGSAEDVTGRMLRKICVALGARFEQRILWQGESLDRLLDQDHARIVDEVVRWLRREGWVILVEATFAIAGERGSIDVLAFHAATGTLLVIEVKAVLPDMQELLAGIDRKGRLAPVLAREHGWSVRKVAKLVVLPGDSTTRCRVETHAATLGAVLPTDERGEALGAQPGGRPGRDPVPPSPRARGVPPPRGSARTAVAPD